MYSQSTFSQSYYNFDNYSSSGVNWYDNAGNTNYIFGLGAIGVEKLSGKTRITTYGNSQLFHFENPNTGRVFYGNKYVRTKALSSIGTKMGIFGFGVGLFIDGIGVINYKSSPTSENSVHPAKAGLNTVMGIYGFTGVGTVPSLLYGAVDGFYPGGWPAAFDELDQLQQENQKILGPNWKIVPFNKFFEYPFLIITP